MRTKQAAAAVLWLCAAGCGELPGKVVGTYRITMTLEENSCGKYAVHLLDGKRYSAQLRNEGERAYWRVPGQSPLPGKYEAPEFRFEYESLVARTQDDAGTPICRLVQSEVLTGRVKAEGDADMPDADSAAVLEGEHVMTVSAEPGANCASALAPAGAFEKLPCELHYALTGERTKSF